MTALSYWFWIGTIYLLWLTWQDYKNNMKVDDRRNWFMLGMTLSLVSHVHSTIIYKLALVFLLMGLYSLMRKIKPLGEADINTFSWIFLGWGLINPVLLGVYVTVFSLLTLLFMGLKEIVFKYRQPVPFYGVILVSYVAVSFVLGMY